MEPIPQCQHMCTMCQKQFSSHQKLTYHMDHRVCKKKKSTKVGRCCKGCNKTYSTVFSLGRHLKKSGTCRGVMNAISSQDSVESSGEKKVGQVAAPLTLGQVSPLPQGQVASPSPQGQVAAPLPQGQVAAPQVPICNINPVPSELMLWNKKSSLFSDIQKSPDSAAQEGYVYIWLSKKDFPDLTNPDGATCYLWKIGWCRNHMTRFKPNKKYAPLYFSGKSKPVPGTDCFHIKHNARTFETMLFKVLANYRYIRERSDTGKWEREWFLISHDIFLNLVNDVKALIYKTETNLAKSHIMQPSVPTAPLPLGGTNSVITG